MTRLRLNSQTELHPRAASVVLSAVGKSRWGGGGGGDVSIFGPPNLPVTMTTAVDGGEWRREAGWPAELRQVLLRFAHRP